MKFRNKLSGEIYDLAGSDCPNSGFCKNISCRECKISPHTRKVHSPLPCSTWIKSHPKLAAELMGYELLTEKAELSQKKLRRVIAIDFDGTLFETDWPAIRCPNWPVIRRAKAEQEKGAALILWTCREGKLLQEALEACERVGLKFDAVNDSLEEWKQAYHNSSRKIGATEYWDDKAVNPAVWEDAANSGEESKSVFFEDYTGETAPDPASRRGILLQAIKCVCGDRDQDYGSPEHSLSAIGAFWADYIKAKYGADIPLTGADTSAMMVLFKMARVATGHGKADNWVDAAGYSACGGELEHLEGQKHADD